MNTVKFIADIGVRSSLPFLHLAMLLFTQKYQIYGREMTRIRNLIAAQVSPLFKNDFLNNCK